MTFRIAIHDDLITHTPSSSHPTLSLRRFAALATALPGLALLVGCDAASSEPERCFPVPAGAHIRVATNGMEEQGTSLQGGSRSPGEQHNGAGLQSGPRPPEEEHNGVGLQRSSPGEDMQGASLQGRAAEPRDQGASLQGRAAGPKEQGASYQGTASRASSIGKDQGTSLQGDAPYERDQGTGLQHRPEIPTQGTDLQGGGGHRAYRGLGDLNGARLALEADASNVVSLRDGQLVARGFADSAALRGAPLVATAPDGRTFRVELAAITLDGRTRHFELAVDGLPVCDAGQHGVFVAGRWDGSGAHVDDATLTYSCLDGVIAKCVSWGYAPWLSSAATHAACTRMARADYCGDGKPWTMDGTLIDIYDRLGIQPQPSGGGFAFEAAWGPAGALCVARARYQIDDGEGGTLLPACFASLPACHSLDEAAALGAELANQSRPAPIAACR